MDLAAAGLREQAFRAHGKPLSTLTYASFQEGLDALRDTHESNMGLALLQGPPLSGKSTLIRHFIETLPQESACAVIDGVGMDTNELLESLLRQFGYLADFNSTSERLAMTRVFALQQSSAGQPPLVIIEDANLMNPSALRAVAELAEVQVKQKSAIKLVLCSNESMHEILDSPLMEKLCNRVVADIHLRPMSGGEVAEFLHRKLRAAGCEVPEFVFPTTVCTALWKASGGWPGILDRLALLALANADTLPVAISNVEYPALPKGTWDGHFISEPELPLGDEPEKPTLYVSQNGQLHQTLAFEKPRLLIGRSEHNDVAIDSRFVSRHHMLLVRNGGTTFLMDLNSTNGSFVNSKRVSNHVLVDSDIISVGNHRIKFIDPGAKTRGELDGNEFADTAIMKTLEDMRTLLEQENTQELPAATENLPTLGG